MDGQRITAQLGCGALILVIVAAYVGAMAGTEGVRPGGSRGGRPSIFTVGNLVRQMGNSQTPIQVVFKVVDVEGAWVKLEPDADATAAAIARTLGAANGPTAETPEGEAALENWKDPAKNPWMAAIQSQYGGQWWLNTANTTEMWQRVALEAP